MPFDVQDSAEDMKTLWMDEKLVNGGEKQNCRTPYTRAFCEVPQLTILRENNKGVKNILPRENALKRL